MSIIKRTVFDRIELGNPLGVRLQKQIFDVSKNTVLSEEPHRIVVPEGASVSECIAAANAYLVETLEYPAVPIDVCAIIEAHRALSVVPVTDLTALMTEASKRVMAENIALAEGKMSAEAERDQLATDKAALIEEKALLGDERAVLERKLSEAEQSLARVEDAVSKATGGN